MTINVVLFVIVVTFAVAHLLYIIYRVFSYADYIDNKVIELEERLKTIEEKKG